jgi:hypothetical protein
MANSIAVCRYTAELELRRYCKELAVSRVRMSEGYPLEFFDEERFRLVYEVYAREAERDVTYPATWWQHFKQRWFPAWLLRRYPVRLTVVTVRAEALFPELAPLRHRHRIDYLLHPAGVSR